MCNLLSCNKSEIVVRELLKLNALKQKKRRLWWWLVGLLGCFGRLFYSSRAVPQSDFPQGCQTVANCNELVFYVMCDISVIYKTKLHYRTDTLLPASSCYLQLHRFFFFPSYFLFIAEFHGNYIFLCFSTMLRIMENTACRKVHLNYWCELPTYTIKKPTVNLFIEFMN